MIECFNKNIKRKYFENKKTMLINSNKLDLTHGLFIYS